jgi:hypothetical protein
VLSRTVEFRCQLIGGRQCGGIWDSCVLRFDDCHAMCMMTVQESVLVACVALITETHHYNPSL